ncbi:MAG: ABC transporter substrate-binding protein, partial [Nitrospinota bacterium]
IMRKLMGGAWAVAALWGGVLSAEGAPQMAKFSMGAVTNTGNMLMFVAIDKGFFAKHGIDAKVMLRDTGADLSKSLDAGELDLSIAAMPNIPVALERGLRARAIVGYTGSAYTKSADDEMMAIIVRPDSGINSLVGLKGKKVGVSLGTSEDLYLQEVLKKNGVPVEALNRINVPLSSKVSLFDTGGVQAMVGLEPYNAMMIAKVKGSRELVRGGGHICFCSSLHGLPERIYMDRDVTQRVVDAMSETAFFVRDPKNLDEIGPIAARYVRGMDPDIVKRTHKFWGFDTRIGKNTFKAFNITVQQLLAQKKMKQPFGPEKYYDTTFIRRTMERHPEWFKDLPGGEP